MHARLRISKLAHLVVACNVISAEKSPLGLDDLLRGMFLRGCVHKRASNMNTALVDMFGFWLFQNFPSMPQQPGPQSPYRGNDSQVSHYSFALQLTSGCPAYGKSRELFGSFVPKPASFEKGIAKVLVMSQASLDIVANSIEVVILS